MGMMGETQGQITPEQLQYIEMIKRYIWEKSQQAQRGMIQGTDYVNQNVMPQVYKGLESAQQGIQSGKEFVNQGIDYAKDYGSGMKASWDKIWRPWPETRQAPPVTPSQQIPFEELMKWFQQQDKDNAKSI